MTSHYPEDLDYKEAQNEAQRLLTEAAITTEVSAPVAAVDAGGGHDGKGWAHTAYVVTYNKGKHLTVTLPYKMGLGLLPNKLLHNVADALGKCLSYYSDDESHLAQRMLKGYTGRLQEQAALVVKIINRYNAQKVVKDGYREPLGPRPAEVLAAVCGDALEASETTFEDWAGNFGYDSDSRKAEAIYNTCRNYLPNMLRLMGREGVERMAELSRML